MAKVKVPPSKLRPKRKQAIPPGTFDLWIVNIVEASKAGFVRSHRNGVYFDEDAAYSAADSLYVSRGSGYKVKVEHKAGIRLADGKIYMVYLNPVKTTDDAVTMSAHEHPSSRRFFAANSPVEKQESQPEFSPRNGALRTKHENGTYTYANPGDPLFSTVSMNVTDFFDGETWVEAKPF